MPPYRKNSRSSTPASAVFGPRHRPATQRILPPLRAPSQFPASPCRDFRAHQVLITESRRVTQPQPDEVRHLVNENPRKLRARAIQSDPPFAQKRPRMHRARAGPAVRSPVHPYRLATERRHAAQNARMRGLRARTDPCDTKTGYRRSKQMAARVRHETPSAWFFTCDR